MPRLGIEKTLYRDGHYAVTSPTDGREIGRVNLENSERVQDRIDRSQEAFEIWQQVHAPRSGELVRHLFGEQLRRHKRT